MVYWHVYSRHYKLGHQKFTTLDEGIRSAQGGAEAGGIFSIGIYDENKQEFHLPKYSDWLMSPKEQINKIKEYFELPELFYPKEVHFFESLLEEEEE